MKEEIQYRLDQFEGPLDLLLSLIEKNKMDITDIPIAEICDQYVSYIEKAQSMDLEVASDFIVTASHLMLMKSKMLLPQEKEEVKLLKEELQDTLERYKQAKLAAEELLPMWAQYSGRMVKEEDEIPPEKGLILGLDPTLLSRALNSILNRVKLHEESPTMINPIIKTKVYSVEERIEYTLQTLQSRGKSSLIYLLKDAESRGEIIAYFMGILELVKINRILICDDEPMNEDTPSSELGLLIKFMINENYVPQNENDESEFDKDGTENEDREAKSSNGQPA